MDIGRLNFLAIGLGVVATMVLGFLWYGPLFGKAWLKIQATKGRKPEDMEAGAGLYLQTILLAIVSQLVLALLIAAIRPVGPVAGAVWGAVI